MIAIQERELLLENAQAVANAYVTDVIGKTYFIETGNERDYGWNFRVQCRREDLSFCPMVGHLTVNRNGRVQTLSDDQIQDMKESAEVYAAKERGDPFARDENGYVLRYHARIKANAWASNNIAMKVGAEGGILLDIDIPLWRFAVHYHHEKSTSPTLDVIDVDAITGKVIPVPQERIETIQEVIRAARRIQKPTAKTVQ